MLKLYQGLPSSMISRSLIVTFSFLTFPLHFRPICFPSFNYGNKFLLRCSISFIIALFYLECKSTFLTTIYFYYFTFLIFHLREFIFQYQTNLLFLNLNQKECHLFTSQLTFYRFYFFYKNKRLFIFFRATPQNSVYDLTLIFVQIEKNMFSKRSFREGW